MPDGSPILRVREVSKSFGAVAVLDLSVAEIIATGSHPLGRFNTIDRTAMVHRADQMFGRLGVSIEFTAADIDRFNV